MTEGRTRRSLQTHRLAPWHPDEPGGSAAPTVENPLDPAKFLDKPCDLVPRDWAAVRLCDHGSSGYMSTKRPSR